MSRFFVPTDCFDADTVKIIGDDARHIARSLRMAVGETVNVSDMRGGSYDCRLTLISDTLVEADIISRRQNDTEPPYRAALYQALTKGDKFDTVVQKSVELGVYSITPFISDRCISRPDADGMKRKTERWQKIAEAAAKQCGRGMIPQVNPLLDFRAMLDEAKGADIPLFCYEGEGTEPLRRRLNGVSADAKTVSIVIGSEGGFSGEEAQSAADAGMKPVGLGKRILRTETAAGFVLSCLSYEFE